MGIYGVDDPPRAILCLQQNSRFRGQMRGFRAGKSSEIRREGTRWRWMESIANRSPPKFPANREKCREFSSFCSRSGVENLYIELNLREFSHISSHPGDQPNREILSDISESPSLIWRFRGLAAAAMFWNFYPNFPQLNLPGLSRKRFRLPLNKSSLLRTRQMPSSMVDFNSVGYWRHTNGEDVYRVHKHTSALSSSGIRAHVLLPAFAQNFMASGLTSRPFNGDAPPIDLVLGYKKSNQPPILKFLLSRLDELVACVST